MKKLKSCLKTECNTRNLAGDPVVKNLPSNAGDVGSIHGQGELRSQTKAMGQLSPTGEPVHSRVHALQCMPVCPDERSARVPQQRPKAV